MNSFINNLFNRPKQILFKFVGLIILFGLLVLLVTNDVFYDFKTLSIPFWKTTMLESNYVYVNNLNDNSSCSEFWVKHSAFYVKHQNWFITVLFSYFHTVIQFVTRWPNFIFWGVNRIKIKGFGSRNL